MPDDFYIKRNDLQPYYYARAQESTGAAIDLTGALIKFTMVNAESLSIVISTIGGVTITAASTGLFHYQWATATTATTGTYHVEFEITPASGGKFTLPVKKTARVIIVADEDST